MVQSTDGEGNTTVYGYNSSSRLASVTDPEGGQETYAYDAEGRLCKKTDRNGTETRCTYNMYGSLLTRTAGELSERYEYTPEGLLKSAVSGGMRYTYTYDAMGRLREKHASGRRLLAFAYDWNGNRTEKQQLSGRTIYEYDSLNHLTDYEKDGIHTEFQYDASGNLVKDDKPAYTYDAFNRNTRVETFDGNIQINRYDAEGLRHEMEENGRLVQFIFRGAEVVAEETREEKVRYIRTHELLASDAESARTYYHYASDELGSITHVTAGTDVINRYGI